MNIQRFKNRLVPFALLSAFLLNPLSAQVRPPTVPVQPTLPAAANVAHDHAHAPGQLEIAPERLQAIRAASAANRSSRLMPQANAAQCTNGDFQSPNFLGWNGKDGTVAAGPTVTWSNILISQGALSGTTPGNNSINTSTAHQTLVTTGTDTYAPISTTAPGGSSMAARIGNGVRGAGAEALTKTFTVTQATMNFWYALVLEDPGHAANIQPGFEIRVYNSTGVDITKKTVGLAARSPRVYLTSNDSRVVAESPATNPFFKASSVPGPNGAKVVYKDWTCSSIDLGDLVNQTVTIEFITMDCGAGGHAGWAYIDDICGTCKNPSDGGVTLNLAASTACGPGKLCFDYTTPKSPGAAAGTTQLSLQLYQNGLAVGAPILSPAQTADGQYCFPMIPAVTPPLNASLPGFDWVVTSTNKIGSTTLSPKFVGTVPNGIVNGTNNDYAMTCGTGPAGGGNSCCPTFLSNNSLISMFSEAAHTPGTPSVVSFVPNSPSHTSFAASVNAYLGLVRTGSCAQVATGIKVTYTLWDTNSTTPPTAIPAGYIGWTSMANFAYTYAGGTPVLATGPASFSLPASPEYVVVVATGEVLDLSGKPRKCSDFSGDCFEKLRFYDINNAGLFKLAPGAVTPSARSKF